METVIDNSDASLSGPNVCTIYGRKYDLSKFKEAILSGGYGSAAKKKATRDMFEYIGYIAYAGAEALASRIYSMKAIPSTFDENRVWELKTMPDGTRKYFLPRHERYEPKKKKFSLLPENISDEDMLIAAAAAIARERWRRERK